MIDSRTFFFCFLLLQQNHRRTERIEIATTPPTVPAMIGTAGLFDDGVVEDVTEANSPALKTVCVAVGVTTVKMEVNVEGSGETVTVAVLGDPESGQLGVLQLHEPTQQPLKPWAGLGDTQLKNVVPAGQLPSCPLTRSRRSTSKRPRCMLNVDQGNAQHNYDYERVNLDKGG
jgi:hypothetical protein